MAATLDGDTGPQKHQKRAREQESGVGAGIRTIRNSGSPSTSCQDSNELAFQGQYIVDYKHFCGGMPPQPSRCSGL